MSRNAQRYTADLHTLLAELREVYEGQIEAKDQVIATQGETIAELRRRAEVAEAELSRRRDDQGAAQAASAGPEGAEGSTEWSRDVAHVLL
jgi:phage shock protein A